MNRLSKREYFLISLLVVLLIWFLGWNQIVKPQMDSLREAGERLEQLNVQREQVERYLQGKAGRTDLFSGEDGTAAGTDFFYTDLDDVAVDCLLVQMAAESGVDIRKMNIGEPALVERKLPGSDTFVYTGMEEVPLRCIQVSLELEAETFDRIAAMAEEIYRVDQSVVTDQLEAAVMYGREASENPASQGVQCTMNVSFYYVDSLEMKGNGA